MGENPFDLVEVKLAPPRKRQGSVPKPDLIERLRAERAPFATVVAPAGYGKTTLLAHWAEADPRPFAWVALDRQDDDAVVFMRYITAAMHRVEPVSPAVFDALSGPGGTAWATRFPRVGNALASSTRPMVLVLDDLHAVGNQSCLDVLSELVRHVPSGSQIVISSREEPALPLARWRASGQVHEIGVADLRLDEEEAGLLLEAAGVELDPETIAELTARTEGWPAGLYLAALSIHTGAAGPADTDLVTGEHRFVAEYFRHELLDRLPPDGARFLTHTSVLEWMSGGLCDSVLDASGSARTLEALTRTNGFVMAYDGRGEWYRYHHLFGELLRNELERSEPDLVRVLNARAMAWCIANDRLEAAVAYGHAAGDTDTVAGLVDALALPVYYDSRIETLEEWLGWFGDDELTKYPALAVFGAWVHVLTGRPAEGERLLALAEGATSAIPLSDGSATIEPWVATLRAHMMRNGVEQALADAELALEQLPSLSAWRPTALLGRAVAHLLLGLVDHAKDDLLATSSRHRQLGRWRSITWRRQNSHFLPPGTEPGTKPGSVRWRHKRLSTKRDWPAIRRARSHMWRRHEWQSTKEGLKRLASSWARPSAPTAARPWSSLDEHPGRARAHTRPSRARRGDRRPHGSERDRTCTPVATRHGRSR